MKKLKAEVTIWQLIVAFQKDKQLLIDELNKIDLSPEATPEEMVALVMSGKETLTFSIKDFPPTGLAHNNALYSL